MSKYLSFLDKCDLLRDLVKSAADAGWDDDEVERMMDFIDDIEEGKVYD